MLQILIIEDELPAATMLERMLRNILTNYKVIGRCDTIESSIAFLKGTNKPDLIFLDIQLGDGLSFEIFKHVDITIPIIFTTAYDEYAIKAFELNSIDYLLKPITTEKLSKAINKFHSIENRSQVQKWDFLGSFTDTEIRSYKQRFLVYTGNTLQVVPCSDIAYFYSLDSNTFLVTTTKSCYCTEMSLDKLETILSPNHFFRVNRKYIASFQSIEKISLLSSTKLKLHLQPQPDDEIIVSSSKNQLFKAWLNR